MSSVGCAVDAADRRRGLGPGRVLAAVYAVFVVAAGARSAVQIATAFDRAPVPYLLSGLAALVYAAQLVAVLRVDRGGRRGLAVGCCVAELVGVAVVGTLSVVVEFPDDTVWSVFGRGYGYLPVLLPLVTLFWLRTHPHLNGFKMPPIRGSLRTG